MSEKQESDSPEESSQDAVEARVRKVRHLDPFSLTHHSDGRFEVRLSTSPEELKPEEASRFLSEVEKLLGPVREVADG